MTNICKMRIMMTAFLMHPWCMSCISDQKADGDKSTEGEADRGFIETIKLTALQV